MSEERARLLAALNAAIEDQDRDLRIGPTCLMTDEAATDDGLAKVWKYDVMPLLEEHYYRRHVRGWSTPAVAPSTTARIRHTDIEIREYPLDLRLEPRELLAQVERLVGVAWNIALRGAAGAS